MGNDIDVAKKYDGLIIITDGWADKPTLPQNFKGYILWMLYSDNAYKSSNRYILDDYTKWIATFSRSRYLILPPIEPQKEICPSNNASGNER